ncbi:MAG: AAA family ATPase [Sphingobacteriaceae bacterium]|nr:AAA family ATPase [Sphingobacteriaceae bacterium]
MSDTAAIQRLLKLKETLQIERDEDYRLYQDQFLRVGIDQRRKNGLTWYPVKINSEELGNGEYLQLEIERTSHVDTPHQFSSGKNINLFSNYSDEQHTLQAIIKNASKNTLKIIVPYDELPDWCFEGKLGINIQFDDNSYQEMQNALDHVIKARNNRTAELREMIEGTLEISFTKNETIFKVQQLNTSQNKALQHILSVNDIGIVHGPPGTGKTTTLIEAIRITLQTENQILVCAPTNTAVDLITEKLFQKGIQVLRLGHPARISDDLQQCSIDGRLNSSPFFKDIKNLRRTAEEYFRMAGKYKRVFGKEDAKQRATFYTEARNCLKEARLLEDHITDDLFKTAQVICCTPVSSNSKNMARKKFRTLFFDEASQALEPMVWIPLLKCERIILSGDHFQLPPVVKSVQAKKMGLAETLFDKTMLLQNTVVLLNHQYRMSNAIMGFSNEYFYQGKLTADASVIENCLVNNEESLLHKSIEFIDTAGCNYDEIQNPESLSFSNPKEGELVYLHLQQLLTEYMDYPEYPAVDVGIIAPYKEQIEWLKDNQSAFPLNTNKLASLNIKTIDGFQGEERDVIYISLVRSNDKKEIGFLSDLRRMNVAITRAKKKLVIIGDSATVGVHPFYAAFLEYCEKNGAYRSAWEWA